MHRASNSSIKHSSEDADNSRVEDTYAFDILQNLLKAEEDLIRQMGDRIGSFLSEVQAEEITPSERSDLFSRLIIV